MSAAVPATTYAAPTTYGAYGSTYGASCALALQGVQQPNELRS